MSENYSAWSLWDWEKEFVLSIARMEQIGVAIDADLAHKEMAIGQSRMLAIAEDVGGSPSSPRFLEQTLLGELGLPIVATTPNGAPSFNRAAMEEYDEMLSLQDNPLAKKILEFRGWQKTCSTFYKAFIEKSGVDGRVHPHYKIHGTKTSRLSCSDPNFQQIPKVRDESKRWNKYTKTALVPTQGFQLWELDYSNLELRLGAEFSGQQNLIDAFNNDEPIWDFMKNLAGFDSKEMVKTFTYATAYGAGIDKIASQLGITLKEAKTLKRKYFNAFPEFKTYGDGRDGKAKLKADAQGYITFWTGRRRHFVNGGEHRKAWNSYLQGGAAEIVKRANVRTNREVVNEECRMVMNVHDSLVVEIRENREDDYLPRIADIMTGVPRDAGFNTKFDVDWHVWGE